MISGLLVSLGLCERAPTPVGPARAPPVSEHAGAGRGSGRPRVRRRAYAGSARILKRRVQIPFRAPHTERTTPMTNDPLARRRPTRRRGSQYGRRSTDREPNRGWGPTFAIILAVAIADWSTKALVAATIPRGALVEVWEGRLALWHVRNPAMILGLWGDLPLGSRKVIAVLAAVAVVLLLVEILSRGHRLPRRHRPWAWVFIGLACGGMLGNLGERAVHWGVTDFLSIGWGGIWLPPGNVADIALFLSIPLAGVVSAFEIRARARRGSADAEPARPAERHLERALAQPG